MSRQAPDGAARDHTLALRACSGEPNTLRGGRGTPERPFFAEVGQVIRTDVAPGLTIVITPPYTQLHMEPIVSAGLPPIKVIGAPGAHGAGTIGVHVPGVSTPVAAA